MTTSTLVTLNLTLTAEKAAHVLRLLADLDAGKSLLSVEYRLGEAPPVVAAPPEASSPATNKPTMGELEAALLNADAGAVPGGTEPTPKDAAAPGAAEAPPAPPKRRGRPPKNKPVEVAPPVEEAAPVEEPVVEEAPEEAPAEEVPPQLEELDLEVTLATGKVVSVICTLEHTGNTFYLKTPTGQSASGSTEEKAIEAMRAVMRAALGPKKPTAVAPVQAPVEDDSAPFDADTEGADDHGGQGGDEDSQVGEDDGLDAALVGVIEQTPPAAPPKVPSKPAAARPAVAAAPVKPTPAPAPKPAAAPAPATRPVAAAPGKAAPAKGPAPALSELGKRTDAMITKALGKTNQYTANSVGMALKLLKDAEGVAPANALIARHNLTTVLSIQPFAA